MKKNSMIGIIILALVIVAGLVLFGKSDKKSTVQETVTIKNAEPKSSDECLDDCAKCPENENGECTGKTEPGNVYVKDVSCDSLTHEEGSPECIEAQKSGKCPGKCPHGQTTEVQKSEKM